MRKDFLEARKAPPIRLGIARCTRKDFLEARKVAHTVTFEGYAAATLSSIALADGTAFAPNASQTALFASLLLDGMRWMTVGTPARWDWSVKGRDMGTVARRVELNVSLLSMSGREDELAAFGAAIDGRLAPALLGHRGYWTSDYAVMRGTSVRLA